MTPRIDIVFQLLIFFLLTATYQDHASLDIDLAQAKSQSRSEDAQKVILTISIGCLFELDHEIIGADQLEAVLCAKAREGDTALHIRADKSSQHASLVTAMDIAKRCGMKSMGILHQN